MNKYRLLYLYINAANDIIKIIINNFPPHSGVLDTFSVSLYDELRIANINISIVKNIKKNTILVVSDSKYNSILSLVFILCLDLYLTFLFLFYFYYKIINKYRK